MNKVSLFLSCSRLLWCSRVLPTAYYTLFYLPALGAGDFAQARGLLGAAALGFLLERRSEGKGEGMISATQRIISFITKDAAWLYCLSELFNTAINEPLKYFKINKCNKEPSKLQSCS